MKTIRASPAESAQMSEMQRVLTAHDYAVREPEGCGVVGVYNHPDAARLCHLALYAMQHRGQESAGIAAFDGKRVNLHKGQGLVSEVFSGDVLDKLPGRTAIGHVRYSTTGSSALYLARQAVKFGATTSVEKRTAAAATVPQASTRTLRKYRNYRKYVKDELL